MRAPKERCLVMLEVKRLASELWNFSENDHERMLIENILVTVTAYLKDLCKRHSLPYS